jgi:two-component sensor histidine kinase
MAAQSTEQSDDRSLSLALAMVLSSPAPLLLLDDACTVIAASASFCRAFALQPGDVVGANLFALGAGEWGSAQLRSLMRTTLSGDAQIDSYEMDLERPGQPGRCLVLNVRQLDYGHPDTVRLLMSVADVTDLRKSDKRAQQLLHDNELLIQEVRHRIANSLQIIASVLMQSARQTQSAETRIHLRDAHQRVMSVAELQQQLAASTLGTVHLRAYLTRLCETITASMIFKPETLSISVEGDDAVVEASVSVSLGLVVTELVINALKHAFPEGRGGKIIVDYRARAEDWTLSVCDDGVGMPVKTPAMAGLGTTIVQALVKQLGAEIEVTDRAPGVLVTITHRGAMATVPRELAHEPAV